MPTYYACGVTARLATTPLKASLSNVTDLRMGAEQRRDAERVKELLSKAEGLVERPIGAPGPGRGVVQFIGANEDMALYMVEASEQLRDKNTQPSCTTEEDGRESSGSPLTSLGATPTPTTQTFNVKSPGKPSTLEQALQGGSNLYGTDEQALVLDLKLDSDSFLAGCDDPSASMRKDIKVEIFVNGELEEVHFVSSRRGATQAMSDNLRFAGTRIHRQHEKPWVYAPDEVPSQEQLAEQRWHATATSLLQEAEGRGTDKFGDLSPTSEYLRALATIRLPAGVAKVHTIGVIDLVVTAGRGRKYGPETAYITGPTRMDDRDYATTNPAVDPILLSHQDSLELFGGGAVVSPMRSMALGDTSLDKGSPDVPLRSRSRKPSNALTPSPSKKLLDLTAGIDFDEAMCKNIVVGAFENRRGKVAPVGRTLFQRLGDLKKMNEQNHAQELEKLKEEYPDAFTSKAHDKRLTEDERPAKRMRADSEDIRAFVDPRDVMRISNVMDVDSQMRDDDVFSAPDPDAVRTQSRIDMALGAGAESSGALLRHIAKSSPQRSPMRRTKAASLAYSPTGTPVKPQRTTGPTAGTPSKRSGNEPPTTPQARGVPESPTKSRGSNRSARKWIPGETTHAEALADFEVPESSKGSCVTFSQNKKATRQIGKVRNGTFKEEQLVVGMRFIVW